MVLGSDWLKVEILIPLWGLSLVVPSFVVVVTLDVTVGSLLVRPLLLGGLLGIVDEF